MRRESGAVVDGEAQQGHLAQLGVLAPMVHIHKYMHIRLQPERL